MAMYREHISVSGLLGVAVGLGSWLLLGFTPVQGILAGWFTAIGGILPDLDSESGRPVREMFGLTASVAPLLLIGRILYWTHLPNEPEMVMVLFLAIYLGIKYGLAMLVGSLSVHRGMFHSIPALLIAAEATYLTYPGHSLKVKLVMGGGVAIGFFSHLLLDELYSVQWSGVHVSLKKSAGSALKMFGPEFVPNVMAYMLLAGLTVVALAEAGIIGPANAPPKHFAITAEAPSATAVIDAAPAPHPPEEPMPVSVDGYPQPAIPRHVPAADTAIVPSTGSDDVATQPRDSVLR